MTSKIIVDSDFLYGLFVSTDPHHDKVVEFLPSLTGCEIIITSLVKYEIITLLSRRKDQTIALNALSQIETIGSVIYFIEQKDDVEIMKEFSSHSSKKISVVDCANLVLARKLKAKIASFDKFYPEEILITNNLF
jgi:predicted nucleic acid-binding protein